MRSLIAPIISFLGVAAALAVLLAVRWTSRRDGKRNPLTRNLLRSPGQLLREQLDNLTLDLMADFACLAVMSSFAGLFFSMVDRPGNTVWIYGAAIGLPIVAFGFFTNSLWRRWQRRTTLRLALDGEMATGEELNQLMLHKCRVFHDIPAGQFNVDHVVVGPAGVFAVETKARSKAARGAGAKGATVTYDGDALVFPRWREREPLEQAKRQADWLRKWLTSAVGEPVDVKPVLALPGWFVDRKALGDVIVINPRNATFLAEPRGRQELSAQMIQRIAHQLEQHCRDVEPLAFRDQRTDSPHPSSAR